MTHFDTKSAPSTLPVVLQEMLPRGSVVTPKRKVIRIKNEDSDNDVDEIRRPKKSNMQASNLVRNA